MTDKEYLLNLRELLLKENDSEVIRFLGQELVNLGIRLKRTGKLE